MSAQNALIVSPNTMAMAISNPGALGSIEAYIAAVNRIPMLSAEEESTLATRLQEHEDLEAARKLVLSHLRLVVSIARQYFGYGLPQADLIQEGNIGLMKAVKRFDSQRGVRLVSFAVHWIKAEIHEFIIRNWRLVKVATTKAQRKLFFNLRRMRPDGGQLDTERVNEIAQELNVRTEDVREMEVRMSGREVSFDMSTGDDDDADFAPVQYLADETGGPEQMLEQRHQDALYSEGLATALENLDPRSKRIVQARWLNNDESLTLHDLAAEFGVSAERIRQIETAAFKKLRVALQDG
ncbi:RNA polymerase sigma factor RpoH [Orrella marina]|uniref:RNA polymerase sigma factor RpoH n=1 Tax=Orrella marina TaxID=2163011 RepID=A0A2R4XPW6_9BURK|nr:RNA polymerase sigma factor RpoH [Orrella marina]AWB35854.1 RNA polymerase sigma factor RpoH [Orrella marina]